MRKNIFNASRTARSSRSAVITAAALALMPLVASGSVPVFGGLSFSPVTNAGYIHGYGSAITNKGYAVGDALYSTPSVFDNGRRAMAYTPAGFGTLPTPSTRADGYAYVNAFDVNEAKTVIGSFDLYASGGNTYYGKRAFRFVNNQMQQLGNLGTPTGNNVPVEADTAAIDISNAGVAIGNSDKYVNNAALGPRAVRWEANSTTPIEMDVLNTSGVSGVGLSTAFAINESGVSVGRSALYFGNQSIGTRPVRWAPNGQITQLGVLTTSNEGYTTGEAVGINNAGVIAANVTKYVPNGNYTSHAVRYAPNSTTAVDLGVLGVDQNGTSTSHVESISNSGLIVGQATAYTAGQTRGTRPVYWTTTGNTAAIPLQIFGVSDQGYTSGGATSANADGVIAGWCSRYVNGLYFRDDAVLWRVGPDQATIDLNTLLPSNSPWVLTGASKISDTGFVSGYGTFKPTGGSPFQRAFSILVPQAGTYGRGDANFDTVVNFDDLIILAQHYNQSNAAQDVNVGDFNLDGVVNFDDLIPLAQHYNTTLTGSIVSANPSFAADWALAQSLVPEPTALAAIALLPLLYRRV